MMMIVFPHCSLEVSPFTLEIELINFEGRMGHDVGLRKHDNYMFGMAAHALGGCIQVSS